MICFVIRLHVDPIATKYGSRPSHERNQPSYTYSMEQLALPSVIESLQHFFFSFFLSARLHQLTIPEYEIYHHRFYNSLATRAYSSFDEVTIRENCNIPDIWWSSAINKACINCSGNPFTVRLCAESNNDRERPSFFWHPKKWGNRTASALTYRHKG